MYTPQRIVRDVGFERNRKRKKETVIRRRVFTGSQMPTRKSSEGLMESVPSGKKNEDDEDSTKKTESTDEDSYRRNVLI